MITRVVMWLESRPRVQRWMKRYIETHRCTKTVMTIGALMDDMGPLLELTILDKCTDLPLGRVTFRQARALAVRDEITRVIEYAEKMFVIQQLSDGIDGIDDDKKQEEK